MIMSIAKTFPVFEADQVLTNHHLNDLFNYLDQQERLTRCKLLGSGIVCGLEVSTANDTINITKGCGLTSQGYIILLCDHTGVNGYKYYTPYTEHDFPADLGLITQCGDPSLGDIPFFTSNNGAAANAKPDILLLLTQSDVDALADKTTATPLSKGLDLSKYAVVLFLDINELKLKNCDTNDCNDKGSRMDLEVEALLVNKQLLPGGGGNGQSNLKFAPLGLRRYNVPVGNLNSSDDVLNAFVNLLTTDSILDNLANDLNYCFSTYKSLLTGINNYSFGTGAEFKNNLNFVRQFHPELIQYYYDFVYDLIKAVYEFKYRAHSIISECCGDEMAFPFHLTLGEAGVSTSNAPSAYRQNFIYSPLFDPLSQGAGELKSLLMRLILMHQGFLIYPKTFLKGLPQVTRITPSAWGRTFLSERCIPYYYKVVHDSTDTIAEDLYYYWSYEKTKRGNARYNLCYDPTPYNTANAIVNPLYYDIEWYDFFRIEGHIGRPIATVLSDLVSKKQEFNLPFDVIALSADYIGALLKGEDPQCVIQDLESDYRLLIAAFICKLHDTFCTAAKQQFTPPLQILEAAPSLAPAAEAAINITIDHPFISGLIDEFQSAASYLKGSTLSRLCFPVTGTFGSYYISSVKANNGNFVNPDPSNAKTTAVFDFIDSIEAMIQLLMNNLLPTLDPTAFKSLYGAYQRTGTALTIVQTCIVEELEALKNEYLRRVAQYRLAKNFNYYFKRHGGIEHKGGVPRGGTFILVYNEQQRNRFVDVRSLFVNQELGNTLLANFRELLQPNTDLNTLEAQTKALAVATLYKDPALYLQYKNTMQQYLDNCNDLPPDKKTQITTIINQPPATPTYQLTDGAVIADFYVPYLCCSDCPPIAYILPPAPAALQVSQTDPECDQEEKNFTVTLTVSGGTPPYTYTINNAPVASNVITLPSGSPDTVVTITDAAKQTATATIKSHTCIPPCNLPCQGLAENCKYILWLSKPPLPGNQPAAETVTHTTRSAVLTLTDENGANTQIPLTDLFKGVLDPNKLTVVNFDGALIKLFAEVSALVKSKAPAFIGLDKPMFTYDAELTGNIQNQTLDIERFTCHGLKLEVEATVTFSDQEQTLLVITAIYDNNGVTLRVQGRASSFEGAIPKFDCAQIDKCAGTSKKSCPNPLIIKELNVNRDPTGNIRYTFKTLPAQPVFDKYFWYFHFGDPLYSIAPSPTVTMTAGQRSVLVRVLGIDSNTGCYSILEQTVNLG